MNRGWHALISPRYTTIGIHQTDLDNGQKKHATGRDGGGVILHKRYLLRCSSPAAGAILPLDGTLGSPEHRARWARRALCVSPITRHCTECFLG